MDENFFLVRKAYVRDPLRDDCEASLSPHGLPGVTRIVLHEVRLEWGSRTREFMVRGGGDLHASARMRGRDTIPHFGAIVRAVFGFQFTGESALKRVEVRTPNTVKMARGCDARAVHEWLSARGFRVNAIGACRTGLDCSELVREVAA